MLKFGLLFVLVTLFGAHYCHAYSARSDASVIAEYRREQREQQELSEEKLNHAKIARKLVHQTNWAAVGTNSTNSQIPGFPMVNIISIDDRDVNGKSTGIIRFVLTDLDFTGPDWQQKNNVTMLFTDEQALSCSKRNIDPMEPTCARTIISGKVIKLSKDDPKYGDAFRAFIKRHPAAERWMKVHKFYLCEFDIENIFVLDFYGGPHNVASDDYYKVKPEEEELDFAKYVYLTVN